LIREFLEIHQIDILDIVDARKNPIETPFAWKMVHQAERIYATRGKHVFDWLPSPETKDEILRTIIGRSGKLRAPTLQIGDIFIVGFDEKLLEHLIG